MKVNTSILTLALSLVSISLCVLPSASAANVTVEGEVFKVRFNPDVAQYQVVVPQAGTVVFFLTPAEKARFGTILKQWIDDEHKRLELLRKTVEAQKAARARQEAAQDADVRQPSNSLIKLYRRRTPDDPRSDDELTVDLVESLGLDQFSEFPDVVKDYHRIKARGASEETREEKELRFAELFPPNLSQMPVQGATACDTVLSFFRGVKTVIADSKGQFSLDLLKGSPYWILACERGSTEAAWCFPFVAGSGKLVLSDSNQLDYTGNPFD